MNVNLALERECRVSSSPYSATMLGGLHNRRRACFSGVYARLATLECANEVAKAARGIASVATIDPPIHAPHVCDPVNDPAASAPPWITTPSR